MSARREHPIHVARSTLTPLLDSRGSDCVAIRDDDDTLIAMPGTPLAFFISFHTYGSWLHGDDAGSVDRHHNTPGTPFVPQDAHREQTERDLQTHDTERLDAHDRWIVHHTICDVCAHRNWQLHAVHVRTNHVHVVVSADRTPEQAMNAFKSWCTRRLVEHGRIERGCKPWSRHGSTRWLWNEAQVADKIDYTLNRQGAPLPMIPPPGVESDE